MKQDVSNALSLMHSKGLTHGDIRPEYIGYDSTSNNYLLLDRFGDNKSLEKL